LIKSLPKNGKILDQEKKTGDRVVHTSTSLGILEDPGASVIIDFGDSQIGASPFVGEVLPDLYRFPEIIPGIPWGEKIDIWSLGLMVS